MSWRNLTALPTRFSVMAGFAAQLAFFLALSLAPLMVVTLTLFGRAMPVDLTEPMIEMLGKLLPQETHIDAGDVIRWARSSAANDWLRVSFLFAIITAWSFSATCLSAIRAAVTGETGIVLHNWRWILNAGGLLLAWMVALFATSVLLLVTPAAEGELLSISGFAEPLVSVVAALRVLFIGLIVFFTAFLTFRMAPLKRVRPWRVWVAAGCTGLGWLVVSQAFSVLVRDMWQATLLYGTLGSVVLFLLWAYLNAWTLLLGSLWLINSKTTGKAR